MLKRICSVLALAVLAGTPVMAQDEGLEGLGFEVRADLVSRYLWRGYDLSHRDPVALVYATWAPPAGKGFWLDAGFIVGLKNAAELGDESSDIDEGDLAVGWEWELAGGDLTLGVAYYYYDYASDWTVLAYEDTSDSEANVYFSWQAAEHFVPSLEYYRGLDDGIEGDYVELGVTLPFELGESWTFEPKVVAGWSNQYDVDNEFTHYTANLPLAWSSGPWTLSASANWTHVTDPESFNPADLVGESPKENIFWAGLQLAWSF